MPSRSSQIMPGPPVSAGECPVDVDGGRSDEIAGEAVEVACEKALFASPEAVAAGINYVTAQLALLNDGTTYAERGDASYAAELAPLRTALELDRFGIVAHVLGDQGCTPERCDALMRFHDSSKALANFRNHTFEEQVKKYTAIWDRPADSVAATAGPPVALPSTTGPGDGQKCDFPSSKSTPPVSIEGPPPREPTASESADVMPLPPRPAPQAPQATPPPAGGGATGAICRGDAGAATPSAPGPRPAAARRGHAAVDAARRARHAATGPRAIPLAGQLGVSIPLGFRSRHGGVSKAHCQSY
jgi:hypothetical protein